MKKLIISVILSLSLAGCVGGLGSFKNPLTPTTIDSLEDSYGAAIAVGVTYKRSCLARLIPKSCFGVVRKLQPYEDKAYNALSIAQRFTRESPTLNAVNVLMIADQAIKAFSSEQFINGVK